MAHLDELDRMAGLLALIPDYKILRRNAKLNYIAFQYGFFYEALFFARGGAIARRRLPAALKTA